MIHEEFYKLAGEYAKKHVDGCLPKNMAKDKKEIVQGNVLKTDNLNLEKRVELSNDLAKSDDYATFKILK